MIHFLVGRVLVLVLALTAAGLTVVSTVAARNHPQQRRGRGNPEDAAAATSAAKFAIQRLKKVRPDDFNSATATATADNTTSSTRSLSCQSGRVQVVWRRLTKCLLRV
jgi:hypothetical protein